MSEAKACRWTGRAYAAKLAAYFQRPAAVLQEADQVPHQDRLRERGATLAAALLRLMDSSSVTQNEIDQLMAALSAEKSPGTAWIELQICARRWAQHRGLRVPG